MKKKNLFKNAKPKKQVDSVLDPHASPTGMGSFISCRRKAWYHRIRKLTMKSPKTAQEVGGLWHKMLEAWYTWQKVSIVTKTLNLEMKSNIEEGFSSFEQPTNRAIAKATLKGMFKGYQKVYGRRDLKIWKFRKAEHEFRINNFLGSGLAFVGIVDGLIEKRKRGSKGIYVLENKTTKDLSYTTVDSIKSSHQTLSYIYCMYLILGVKPKGIIWNAIRKPSKRLKKNQTVDDYCKELEEDYPARPDFYFFRQELIIPWKRIELWLEEVKHILNDMQICYAKPNDKALWYKNTELCGMYGGCEFAPLCFRGEKRSTLALYRPIVRR